MTVYPGPVPAPEKRSRITLPRLAELQAAGTPIVMVTAYDYPSARVAEQAGVDIVLVGDSGAMTVLGYPSTVPITVDELLMLARAVRRGVHTPLLVADLPFGSYESSDEQAVRTAVRFVKEAGCDAVKIEGGNETIRRRAAAIIGAGIPVVGHVGLTPQTAGALGGFKAQGRTAAAGERIFQEATALERAGCSLLIFEAIPSEVASVLVGQLSVPVIGIGAGAGTDGQVLVFHDLLGIGEGPRARFVQRYADLQEQMVDGVARFAADVRSGDYPQPHHGYGVSSAEVADLRRRLSEPSDD